ncbi:hypothetical protein [Pseudocitrobacter sp. 73]|uniref:hypothetical protein n=1 Tax=Pseudocitrobacter sp. 73 TaxID=2605731 RepID=UPI0011EC3CCB|nr:hypothetical protein [Pseudocitrobacter sp. 73]KAA1045560.1 hypothetical protein F0Q32_24740 [Pseudocitrobacter sp. 73]
MSQYLINITPEQMSFNSILLIEFKYVNSKLEIILAVDQERLCCKVSFDWVHSLRMTDEGDLLKTLGEGLFQRLGIFIVKNSSYYEWFNTQSCGIHECEEIKHYCLVTANEVVEVLASIEPEVIVVEKENQ